MTATIAASEEGTGDAVLLLHGQPGSSADWTGVSRALRDRFRVIAPDRPGYGATGGRAMGMAENAAAMAQLLRERGVERAIVAGHSWGAGVAIAMGERHPELVRALVLICPVTPHDRFGLADRALADRRMGPALARGAFYVAGTALGSARMRRRLEHLLPGYGVERSPEVAREWRSGQAWRSFYREQRALFDELPGLRGDMDALRAPVTVVVGGRDFITDPQAGRRFAEHAGGRLVEIAGAGHLLPMQAPGRVAEAIAGA